MVQQMLPSRQRATRRQRKVMASQPPVLISVARTSFRSVYQARNRRRGADPLRVREVRRPDHWAPRPAGVAEERRALLRTRTEKVELPPSFQGHSPASVSLDSRAGEGLPSSRHDISADFLGRPMLFDPHPDKKKRSPSGVAEMHYCCGL